jgi:hypothetical protein
MLDDYYYRVLAYLETNGVNIYFIDNLYITTDEGDGVTFTQWDFLPISIPTDEVLTLITAEKITEIKKIYYNRALLNKIACFSDNEITKLTFSNGDIIFNTTSNLVKVYTNNQWN